MAGETVLLVDDDPAVLEVLREILEQAGYRVETACDGRQGLLALEKVNPQIVISDIGMPEMDGYQLCVEVRSRPKWVGLPFVLLSGRGNQVDVRAGKKLGVDDYLVKPVDEEDLLVVVRSRLDRRAQLEVAREGQVEKLKRDILATLNHEFRTPLTWLVGFGELLRDSGPELDPEQLGKVVEGILAGSERLQHLVEDLVLLVDLHSDAAQRNFDRQRGNLKDVPYLLHQAVDRAQRYAEAQRVELVAEVPSVLPSVNTQPELLSQAVGRLLDNAIKFSKKDGGQVTLTARGQGGLLRIEVRDLGIGIAAEELSRIADLFHQVDRAHIEQQGCGTGLSIARGIVALHGGTLTVESQVGVGSTFTIELPTVSGTAR